MLKTRTYPSIFITAVCFAGSLSAAVSSENPRENSNGQPNAPARLRPNSTDFDIFANLLVWTAKEAGADCWAEAITSTSSSISNDLKEVHFGWDPGFRVGIGYGMKRDQWDTQLYYTWFYTRGTDHVSGGPGTIHSTFLGNFYIDNFSGSGITGPAYQSASIDWKIRFNIFDWELGRNFWVSKALALRPFIGVKGGWIDQSIHSKWRNPHLSGAEFFNVGTENLKNNFWGIGPSAGINTQWVLFANQSQFFSLFGDFSGAMMWGHWSFSDVFKNDIHQKVTVGPQSINSGASMFRLFMGFKWDANFKQARYRFSTKLGYEMQFWLDQLQFYSFTGGRLDNELTLQGGTLEFCFNF